MCTGRKMRNAPSVTAGMYSAVLTYQPKFVAISLNTASDELRGPTKNIFISPPEAFQKMRFMQNATTQSTTKVIAA